MAINNISNLMNNSPGKVGNNTPSQQGTSAPTSDSTTASKTAVAQDAVVLTDQAHSLNKLQPKVKDAPSVNQSKVESLKAAIERGEYKVDSERLAKKMVTLESELGKLYK